MSTVHELKILTEYLDAIDEGCKSFEIRKNDRDYKVGNFLLLKEYKEGRFTGRETLQRITYMTNYEQKESFVVMAICNVPVSFKSYLKMSEIERNIFEKIVSHIHLYGYGERDVSNTFWEILRELIGRVALSESDQQWYMEYWEEE